MQVTLRQKSNKLIRPMMHCVRFDWFSNPFGRNFRAIVGFGLTSFIIIWLRKEVYTYRIGDPTTKGRKS